MRRVRGWLASSCAIVAVIAGLVPDAARADGDPASDVLATQAVFVPWDAGVSVREAAELGSLLAAAARSGFPIRVALVDSPADLGSVTALWGRPVAYAQFLGEELSLLYHGRVLVVMPDGLGLSVDGHPLAVGGAVSRQPSGSGRPGPTGAVLAAEASAAVRRLAAATDHPIGPLTASPRAHPVRVASHVPAGALAFVIGLILIAGSWAASLHVRPPGGRMRRLFSG